MAIVREIRIALRDAVPRRDEAKSALLLECPMGAVVCTEVPALVHVLLRAWRGLGARTGSTVRILRPPRRDFRCSRRPPPRLACALSRHAARRELPAL